MFKKIADNKNPDSLATRSRRKRFEFFISQLNKLPKPVKILDIGGTEDFWEMMNFTEQDGVEIYLLNLEKVPVKHPKLISIKGDATNLSQFEDKYFDIVFSNSVIEHLYSWENQVKMAKEVIRTGKNYFIQTPNFWFPIEPHFVFPMFQFLPVKFRQFLISNFSLGHVQRIPDKQKALNQIKEIRLLSEGELKKLFPDFRDLQGQIYGFEQVLRDV